MTKQSKALAAEAQAASPKPEGDAETLRDRFAMHAPPAPAWWINGYMQRTGNPVIDAHALAEWSFEFADAAMVERAK